MSMEVFDPTVSPQESPIAYAPRPQNPAGLVHPQRVFVRTIQSDRERHFIPQPIDQPELAIHGGERPRSTHSHNHLVIFPRLRRHAKRNRPAQTGSV